MVELVVAASLTAAFAGLMLVWLSSLGGLASVRPGISGAQQSSSVFTATLRADTDAAVSCDPQRHVSPVGEVTPSSVTLYRDADADGVVDQVRWFTEGTTLYRQVVAGSAAAPCVYPAPGEDGYDELARQPQSVLTGVTTSPGSTLFALVGADPSSQTRTDSASPSSWCGSADCPSSLALSVAALVDTGSPTPLSLSRTLLVNATWAAAPGDVGPPSAPVIDVAASSPTSGKLFVVFDPPAYTGGVDLIGYEYTTDDGVSWAALPPPLSEQNGQITVDPSFTSLGVPMADGMTYLVRLRVANAAGYVSSPSNLWAVAVGTVPGLVTSLSCTSQLDAVTVSWVAPTYTAGFALTEFRVDVLSSLGDPTGQSFTVPASQTQVQIPSGAAGSGALLTSGTTYRFAVAAGNPLGFGPSLMTTMGCMPYGPPSAPLNVTVTGQPQRLLVSWNAPASNGGSVTNYDVQRSVQASSAGASTTRLGKVASAQIDALQDASTYFVRVRAVSGTLTGEWSAWVAAETPQPMVMRFDTRVSPGKTVSVPLRGAVDAEVFWGDGSSTPVKGLDIVAPTSYTYAADGAYDVRVYGTAARLGTDFTHLAYGAAGAGSGGGLYPVLWPFFLGVPAGTAMPSPAPGIDKLVAVTTFGQFATQSLHGAFAGAANLTDVPTSLPATVTSLRSTFAAAVAFNDPDVASWDTSAVTDLTGTFAAATSFNQPIGAWNTAQVVSMSEMFSSYWPRLCVGGPAFNQPIGSWNTANVTDLSGMFCGALAFNQPIGSWNTAKVTTMSRTFGGASAFNQPLANWNTANVTTMASMFGGFSGVGCSGARAFNQPIGSWDTTKVTDMGAMFCGAEAFNQNISTWNTANVTNMSSMFYFASTFNQPIGTWSTGNVTNMAGMFSQCSIGVSPGAFNQPIGSWDTTKVTDMGAMFCGQNTFNQSVAAWNTANVTNMASMFKYAAAFNRPVGTWNTAKVTSMASMFSDADVFNQAIGTWNTANVTNMSSMFYNAPVFNQPIGTWNTAKVTSMASMFSGATNFNRAVGSWSTAAVTDMSSMFARAEAFNQAIGTWTTTNVTNMSSMFAGAEAFNQNIGAWNTAKVTTMNSMFAGARAFNQPIGTWNTANVTDTKDMFSRAHAFNQPIGTWDTAKVTNMSSMFFNAMAFNQPIGTWNTANVTDMSSMFQVAYDFNQPIGTWNTAKVTNMSYMFSAAQRFNQNLAAWNVQQVTNMTRMFSAFGFYDFGAQSTYWLPTDFNQSLTAWLVRNVRSYANFSENNPGYTAAKPSFGSPYGVVDSSAGVASPRSVRVQGWTIDPDITTPVNVRVLVNGYDKGVYTANKTRFDVGNVYPYYGSAHGYDITVPVTNAGTYPVCVWAFNTDGGANSLLGCITTSVP